MLETDHTVVLGWSESIYTIIGELCIANESRRRPAVVVMADRDSVAMEEDLRAKVPDLRGTRLVCRSGSPMDVDELAVTHPAAARSIIVLAPETDDPDAEVIKTLLALSHMEGRTPRVVAEIREQANLGAARLVVGQDAALLHVDDTIARLLVQTSRQSGAGAVYAELFDFDGDEIYFLDGAAHGLGELDYAAAQLALEDVTVIGVADVNGVRLNPPPSTPVGAARLVVAADDGVLVDPSRSTTQPDPAVRSTLDLPARRPSTSLVLGWNHRTPVVLSELDSFSEPGSRLTLLTSVGTPRLPRLENIEIEVVEASTTDRRVLEQHVVAGLDHVLVLAYSDDLGVQAADARTLVTLLHVRDLLGALGDTTPVVSEMLDDRNRALAQVSDIDDVVVSGEIVSLLVAQLSEDPRLQEVFAELLGAEGSEVYLRPAEAYVATGAELTWASVVAAVSARGETALGLKSATLAEDGRAFGVRLNLPKSVRHVLHPEDRVVVLAAD
ncbi:MAG: CASTOR/POLLUX-related putative ion channel [Nocardioides sp.]